MIVCCYVEYFVVKDEVRVEFEYGIIGRLERKYYLVVE